MFYTRNVAMVLTPFAEIAQMHARLAKLDSFESRDLIVQVFEHRHSACCSYEIANYSIWFSNAHVPQSANLELGVSWYASRSVIR